LSENRKPDYGQNADLDLETFAAYFYSDQCRGRGVVWKTSRVLEKLYCSDVFLV